ncbi:PhoX family protein [Sphingomonas turrisvirgatae]|uniref:Phosphatase n=1 Tax=Sphingomonas turrisvirgatae TaxID=1888892 RepID=A0A1E3M0A1_9SPHN|nr:PhoX family phosphatase [Sphingomonas turrisvirgatae]ODP39419.1 phosphatase [Sphingomonas turrisvirgatae]
MTQIMNADFAYCDGDIETNRSTTTPLGAMIEQRYSRRATLRSGGGAAAAALLGGTMLSACDGGDFDSSPTVVSIGSSGSTTAGRVVTLTAEAKDDGALTAAWVQTAGPPVALSGANTNAASFIAPGVSAPTVLTFQYNATDTSGQIGRDTVSVTIAPAAIGFAAVAKNKNDVVTVPAGYTVTIGGRTGDPIAAGVAAYANNGTDTNFAQRVGDQHDGLNYFGLSATGTRDDASSTRGLIVQNYENILTQYLHVGGSTSPGGVRPESEAIKEIEAHGVGVLEYVEGAGRSWAYVPASSFNRRITPNTPMTFSGPVRGTDYLVTPYSTDGTAGRGTINNCANGSTAWATYLTCEENWAGYFRRSGDNANRTAKEITALARAGVSSSTGSYGWSTVVAADSGNTLFRRWDARATTGGTATTDWRNEPNQFGWVVEIDPYVPTSTPRKRTALGRFNHEGCWPGNMVAGRKPAWYMGDDAQNEYLYKFVSATPWTANDAAATDRLAMGDKYLDTGILYVAVFNANGTGEWRPLVFGTGPLTASNATYPFASQADVLVNTRLAADALGATPMDRPEWTAVNPATGELYLTLTNNSSRTPARVDATNPRAYLDPPSTSRSNRNGHILRLREAGDTTEALTFAWDIYAFGAGSDLDPTNINLSGLTADNDFSSPDGLRFGRASNVSGQNKPFVWLQTDDGAFTDVTNNQMLLGLPGSVNDGGTRTVSNADGAGGTVTAVTRIGAAPGGNLRRFLIGPVDCEITGVDSTPDGRTLFVGVQHPGEGGTPTAPTSNWPATQASGTAPAGTRPRSALVVITKNDGGVVGL